MSTQEILERLEEMSYALVGGNTENKCVPSKVIEKWIEYVIADDKIEKEHNKMSCNCNNSMNIGSFCDTTGFFNIEKARFGRMYFRPQEDITAYELAQIMILFSDRTGSSFKKPIAFYSLEAYNDFIVKYNHLLKHLEIVIYGNCNE